MTSRGNEPRSSLHPATNSTCENTPKEIDHSGPIKDNRKKASTISLFHQLLAWTLLSQTHLQLLLVFVHPPQFKPCENAMINWQTLCFVATNCSHVIFSHSLHWHCLKVQPKMSTKSTTLFFHLPHAHSQVGADQVRTIIWLATFQFSSAKGTTQNNRIAKLVHVESVNLFDNECAMTQWNHNFHCCFKFHIRFCFCKLSIFTLFHNLCAPIEIDTIWKFVCLVAVQHAGWLYLSFQTSSIVCARWPIGIPVGGGLHTMQNWKSSFLGFLRECLTRGNICGETPRKNTSLVMILCWRELVFNWFREWTTYS